MITQPQDEALGRGLRFPYQLSRGGGLAMATDEERIRQSIILVLSTARGERVMRPEFGCDLRSFVFATIDSAALTMIKSAVREALMRWEPRIEVRDVRVHTEQAAEGSLFIDLDYTIRRTNFPANLVYPFYLHHESQ